MSDTPPTQTLTVREMAIAKWILEVAERYFPEDDRKQLVGVATAGMILGAADENGLPVDTDSQTVRKFGLTIKQGCEAQGASRAEAAIATFAVALALVKKAAGHPE